MKKQLFVIIKINPNKDWQYLNWYMIYFAIGILRLALNSSDDFF